MHFEWYKELNFSDEITQGDILVDCVIPIPNNSLYDSLLNESDEVEEPIEIKTADLIVLSQACDIQNEKIDSIVLCPIWALSELIKVNPYYKATAAKESLRQGKEPSYHLLNSYSSSNITMDLSVVDFHQLYTLPKKFLIKKAFDNGYRIRLLPPYREHLSQAFARYFMRVGLPVDIPREDVKSYSA